MTYTDTDATRTISHFIDTHIEDSDIKVNEIARRIGVSPREVTRWRYGQHDPRLQSFIAFCEVLKIPPADAIEVLRPAAYISKRPFL